MDVQISLFAGGNKNRYRFLFYIPLVMVIVLAGHFYYSRNQITWRLLQCVYANPSPEGIHLNILTPVVVLRIYFLR